MMNTITCIVLVIASLMASMVHSADVVQVTIDNIVPRYDTTGTWMDIHDGNILLIDDTYYWYGAAYGMCKEPPGPSGCNPASIGACGFQQNHNVSLYTSKDLGNWTFQGHVYSAASFSQPAVLFCPKVIYNPSTKLYVLWFNWIGSSFAESYYAAAVSSTPAGPFKVTVPQISTGWANTGDFNLFVDSDGQAYVIYTAHIQGNYSVTHQMSIERLTPDFQGTLGLTANTGFFGASFVEAPALFTANGLYYAVFGQCCCYCASGSPVYVYTATNVMGPYSTTGYSITAAIPAQQTDIMSYYVAPGKYQYLWMGDRWQSAPDGIKGHDFIYIGPIIFINESYISPLPFNSKFTVDVYLPSN